MGPQMTQARESLARSVERMDEAKQATNPVLALREWRQGAEQRARQAKQVKLRVLAHQSENTNGC